MSKAKKESKESKESDDLPEHWGLIQGAIWMVGIAILAFTGWWWPGIMVLVAISLLSQAAIRFYLNNQEEKVTVAAAEEDLEKQRAALLPEKCPNCGSPATVENAEWVGPLSAQCSFCGMNLVARNGK